MTPNTKSIHRSDSYVTGILLVNLGSPAQPTTRSVAHYLKEFLSDRRVIEVPAIIWFCILRFIILPFRSARVARLYASIWTTKGAPLVTGTQALAQAIARKYTNEMHIEVSWAMRYGQPDIDTTIERWQQKGLERLIVLPLYPQYAASTVATVFDRLSQSMATKRWLPELHFINSYHNNSTYVKAIAQSIRNNSNSDDLLLFSFHGLPRFMLEQGDPYFCHCHTSARLIAEELALDHNQWKLCFQSRFGNKPWLQPYTDRVLEQLPATGVDRVRIVCPGFAIDCLETLEEIAIQNRLLFLNAGGKEYTYIPCLNSSTEQVRLLCSIIDPLLEHWQRTSQQHIATSAQRRYQSYLEQRQVNSS